LALGATTRRWSGAASGQARQELADVALWPENVEYCLRRALRNERALDD
jgi:hypothetical protein